jgi:N-acetylglucosaminyldiphosphoundecaprenol N-acetyl-beta-D-mannosaminyltransferase
MQNLCLEWVYRLAQEPRRLLRRYLGDLWGFGHAIIRQWWRMQFRLADIQPVKRDPDPGCEENWQLIKFPSRLDMAAVQRESIAWESTLASTRCCFIDLQDVRFIDSTGMGALIRFQKKARITGQHLVLIGTPPPVKKALALMRLSDFFTAAPDLETAKKIAEQRNAETVRVVPQYFSGKPSLFWNGELTAANAEEVWARTRDHINLWVQRRHTDLVIDLEKLNFIDSSGVSLMLRARKFAGQSGLRLSFVNAQPNVRAVLRLMKLEAMLLK